MGRWCRKDSDPGGRSRSRRWGGPREAHPNDQRQASGQRAGNAAPEEHAVMLGPGGRDRPDLPVVKTESRRGKLRERSLELALVSGKMFVGVWGIHGGLRFVVRARNGGLWPCRKKFHESV